MYANISFFAMCIGTNRDRKDMFVLEYDSNYSVVGSDCASSFHFVF